jgi:putative ABC transport system substrate-binding protein
VQTTEGDQEETMHAAISGCDRLATSRPAVVRLSVVWLTAAVVFILLALAPASEAQSPAVRVGALTLGLAPTAPAVEAFRQALREHGYVEGQNLTVEFRFAERRVDRLHALAAELVRLKVDVIVVEGTPAALAAKQATRTIPIVVAAAGDPVKSGLVASLARPGGNITGLTLIHPELSAKRLQLLVEAVPRLGRVAVIWNPSNPVVAHSLRETEVAARTMGVQLQGVKVPSPAALDGAFSEIADARPGALIVLGDGMLWSIRDRIVELALRSGLPALFPDRDFVTIGGLLSYGHDLTENIRRAAALVDKILKGSSPADLPVEQPTKLELAVNLKTAKTLGLTLPPSLLARADHVIQ